MKVNLNFEKEHAGKLLHRGYQYTVTGQFEIVEEIKIDKNGTAKVEVTLCAPIEAIANFSLITKDTKISFTSAEDVPHLGKLGNLDELNNTISYQLKKEGKKWQV